MCGRFTLANRAAAFNAMPWLRDIPPLAPRYNIAPGQMAFILCDSPMPMVRSAHWGINKTWTSATTPFLINARSEKVLETPTFAQCFRHRRCVIPADGFYEWRKTATVSEPFLFQLTDSAPFCLAGLYDLSGDELNFVILTTTANSVVKPIHSRMPVIISPSAARSYISAPPDAAATRNFFQPYSAKYMNLRRVSSLVNRVENDCRACMDVYEPPVDQQGSLFT